jgi:hypothetical protein
VTTAETGDEMLVEATAFVTVAGVCVAADGLTAPATEASAPVVVPASEVGAWATVAIGALPEVAVEEADPAAVAAGTADVAEAELTAPDPELVESLPGREAPDPLAPAEGLGAAAGAAREVVCEAVEETGDVAELTAELSGDVAELAAEVTGDAAEPTAEVTGDAVELTVEVTVESGDPSGVSEAAACACRENRSMITNIPAATIANCTARRAMRRTIGCGMSSSHWPETGRGTRAHYQGFQSRAPRPSYVGLKLDMLFGHHRTARSQDHAR